MKNKNMFFFLIFFFLLMTNSSKVNADSYYPIVHYDIHNISYKTINNKSYVYIDGWAFIRGTYNNKTGVFGSDHVNHYNPKYTLILIDNWGNETRIEETEAEYEIEKTSLTCTQYTRYDSKYPWCYSVLNGEKYKGLSGKAGVNQLINDTYTLGNRFYENVGFSFLIDLKKFDCVQNNVYTMVIEVESYDERAKKTEIIQTEKIQVLKDRVDSNLRNVFVTTISSGTIKYLGENGHVQRDPIYGIPWDYKYNNTIISYFSGKDKPISYDRYFRIVPGTSKKASANIMYNNVAMYYGIYYYETPFVVEGGYAVPPRSYSKNIYYGWMPASWGSIRTECDQPTKISIPCGGFDPLPSDSNLSCGSSDKKVTDTKGETVAFANKACYVSCNETIDVTLPKRPDVDKAGKGFAYDVIYKTNRSCNINYINGSGQGGAQICENSSEKPSKEEIDDCNNWNVLDSYKANPTKISLTTSGADYFNSHETLLNQNIDLEEVDRKVIQTDRLNGGYEITYRLPQTYLETVTGKIYFNNDPSKSLIDGGRKFYTNKFYEKGMVYNLDLVLEGLGNFNIWNIKYDCDYSTVKNELETPDNNDDDPKGYIYPDIFFRPISLSNPFPGREPGSNWKGKTDLISTTKNGSPLYDDTNIMYEITLDKNSIQEIREYNKNLNYNYLDNSLDSNGKSIFIKNFGHIFNRK